MASYSAFVYMSIVLGCMLKAMPWQEIVDVASCPALFMIR